MPKNIKPKYIKICLICHREFITNKPYRIYCSRECQIKAKRFSRLGKNEPLKYKRICPTCNKKFITNRKNQIYCSSDCSKHKKKLFAKICPTCNKQFLGRKNKIYCSRECGIQIRTEIIDANMREYYLEKFNFTCQKCYKVFNNGELHIHHIIPLYKGGRDEESNLTLLCKQCHYQIHREMIKDDKAI